ncbi:hypothetical protein NLJ89_g2728 [Agrocybe chaxingu]|uniref:Uncharacterized protein n=1 Tax=Agrocybe chaxingu TaxID=84603 RepID=A0A9W8K5D0_9AGAR|nr:hypothetical protein NLJ89_g2728 [Agrocybe chaxingu]
MPHVNLTSRIGTFLPLRCLVFISHVILFCSLWHLRARHALHLLITIVGFTILAALLASLIPRKGTWCTRPSLYSHPLRFSCDGMFAGLNAALPILASPYFFPQKKWLASLYSTMILLAGFNWAEPVLDLLGLVVGITVAATFFIFVPQPAYLEDDGGALPSPVGAFPASPVAGPEPCGREQEQETTPVPAILPKSPEPVANGVAEPVVEPAVDDVTDKVRKRASMSSVPLPKGPRRQRASPGRSGTAQTPPPPRHPFLAASTSLTVSWPACCPPLK